VIPPSLLPHIVLDGIPKVGGDGKRVRAHSRLLLRTPEPHLIEKISSVTCQSRRGPGRGNKDEASRRDGVSPDRLKDGEESERCAIGVSD
tara:strand:+ start:323 stop:592 length:270 start_codon:yes stop_codon:yes gene_type:complete